MTFKNNKHVEILLKKNISKSKFGYNFIARELRHEVIFLNHISKVNQKGHKMVWTVLGLSLRRRTSIRL